MWFLSEKRTQSEFYIHGSVCHGSNWITVEQDATVFSLLYFCRQLYMFRVLTPIIGRSYSCNYNFWHCSGSVHHGSNWITVEQDATLFSLLYFCRQLYMFRALTPIIGRSYSCNYNFWHCSGSVHHGSNWITVEQDATLFSLFYFCRQLYMFRVLTPIIGSSYSCNYSFWHCSGSVHHGSNWITVEQDATVYSLLYFCRQLYMFRALTPIIGSSYNCNYNFWHCSGSASWIKLNKCRTRCNCVQFIILL